MDKLKCSSCGDELLKMELHKDFDGICIDCWTNSCKDGEKKSLGADYDPLLFTDRKPF